MTPGTTLDRTTVVVEAVQSVLNVYFYICLRSAGILKKWSWESHRISFPDLCGNPVICVISGKLSQIARPLLLVAGNNG